MAILRKDKRNNYTVIDNNIFRDKSISLKAKGLLCLMLSLPDNWAFSVEGLASFSNDGITTVRTALNELEENHYLKRNQLRTDNGKMAGVEYVVSENPMAEEPISENPISDNLTLLNTNIQNTDIQNTNTTTNNSRGRFKPPTLEEVQAYIDEKGYSVDAERFMDYYTANGWRVGKSPMKDYKATIRNWERNNGTNLRASNSERNWVRETAGTSDQGTRNGIRGIPQAPLSYENQRGTDDA